MTKEENKKVGLMTVLGWVFGILFILSGLGNLILNTLTGIYFILAGIIILPFTNNFIQNKFNFLLSRGLRIFIALIFIVLAIVSTNDGVLNNNVNTNIKSINYQTSNNINTQNTIDSDTIKSNIKKEIPKDECSFTGYQCQNKNIISCNFNGNYKEIKIEKTCLRNCITGHCVYNEGDTITKDNVGVTLEFANDLYIPAKFAGSGEYQFKVSDSQELFKVRIKVTNNNNEEKYFSDPSYNMVILDNLGNQYEPILFYGDDKDKKDFGSGDIYPGVTKIGDIYFDKLNENAKEIRIIIKDGFFTIYTNDENKEFLDDKSFEWVKKLK